MKSIISNRPFAMVRLAVPVIATVLLFCATCVVIGSGLSEAELKSRVDCASKGLLDISMTGTVMDVDRKVLESVDPSYARLLELKSARVSIKFPDKIKMEGKLGMVKFEYIINGGLKISRAPTLRFKKKEDYSGDPAKLQTPLDVGIVTPALWRNRRVEVVDSPDAAARGEIEMRLRWLKGDMYYMAWLDAKNLWLKKIEKRDGQNTLKVTVVYSEPKNIGGMIWVPTVAEMFSPDGKRAGRTEMSDIKYNNGLQDSNFE